MTSFTQNIKDQFSDSFDMVHPYLSNIRQEAQKTLFELDFPHIKLENWKFTNLRVLSKTLLSAPKPTTLGQKPDFIQSPEGADVIVFVNGFFVEEWSKIVSKEVQILNFDTVQQAIVEKYYAKVAPQKNYFNALNTALPTQGLLVHIPKNKVLEKPIIVYKLTDASSPILSQLRNLIIAEENSQSEIIEIHKSLNEGEKPSLHNEVNEIILHTAANLKFHKWQDEATNLVSINTTEVLQHDKSYFSAGTFSVNGGIIRNNLNVAIEGQHCESFMTGLSFLKGKTLVDNHTIADHRRPNCNSNEFYKGIYDEQSTGIFNGIVYVQEDAQKTNAFQQNRNILLTEEASIYTKPQLEIWADDVKCSHGATTGQLDENALFYLKARGVGHDKAIALLLQAFAAEITERIEGGFYKQYIEKHIEQIFAS